MGDPFERNPSSQIDGPFALDGHAFISVSTRNTAASDRSAASNSSKRAGSILSPNPTRLKSRSTSPQWRDRWPD
jgi:hypothetical protein